MLGIPKPIYSYRQSDNAGLRGIYEGQSQSEGYVRHLGLAILWAKEAMASNNFSASIAFILMCCPSNLKTFGLSDIC